MLERIVNERKFFSFAIDGVTIGDTIFITIMIIIIIIIRIRILMIIIVIMVLVRSWGE